jgi:hypothetical protein
MVEGSLRLPLQFYWATSDAKDYIEDRPEGESKTGRLVELAFSLFSSHFLPFSTILTLSFSQRFLKASGILVGEWVLLLLIGVPVIAIAGPPVLVIRAVRKTGKLFSSSPSSSSSSFSSATKMKDKD